MKRTDLALLEALVLLVSIYAASDIASLWLTERFFDVPCSLNFLSLSCRYGADAGRSITAYAALAAIIAGAMLVAATRWREHVITPFLWLMGFIGLGAIAYDLAFARPVLVSAKIINDTENILSFVILASFALMLAILRRGQVRLGAIALAGLASYSIKVLIMFVFLMISQHVMGATELYLLYIAYAFGTFTIHIMTVSALVSRIDPAQLTRAS